MTDERELSHFEQYKKEVHQGSLEKAHEHLAHVFKSFMPKPHMDKLEAAIRVGNQQQTALLVRELMRGGVDEVKLQHYEELVNLGLARQAETYLASILTGGHGHDPRHDDIEFDHDVFNTVNINTVNINVTINEDDDDYS